MFCFLCARFAEEGQCDLTHRVESRQEGCRCQSKKHQNMAIAKCIRKDFIL